MGYIEQIRKKIGHDLLIGVGAGVNRNWKMGIRK